MRMDLHSHVKALVGVGSAVHTADNTPAAVDLLGFSSAEILLSIGVGGITFDSTNKIEIKVTHSDDNSTYTAVADADMLGVTGITSGIIKSLVAAHAAAAVYRYGYRGKKRYLKVLFDFSGTHGTGTPMSAIVLAGHALDGPVAAQA